MSEPTELPLDGPVAWPGRRLLHLVAGRIATKAWSLAPPVQRAEQPTPRAAVRIRRSHTEWVDERLSARDRAIVTTVERLRVATGPQLERLHFSALSERSRARNRRNVLHRLSDWRVLAPLDRRIGGERRGSDALVFALDVVGQHLVRRRTIRRPYTPRIQTIKHALAVSERYVELVEAARTGQFELLTFLTEPRCWFPDGPDHWLKPDAYLRLASPEHIDAWWLEQDMHTKAQPSEDVPTIRRKMLTYLDFVGRGELGPRGITPRVLFAVQDDDRYTAVARLIAGLPDPAPQLFHVSLAAQAVDYMARVLND